MSTSFVLSPFFYTPMLLEILLFINYILEFTVWKKQTLIKLHKLNLGKLQTTQKNLFVVVVFFYIFFYHQCFTTDPSDVKFSLRMMTIISIVSSFIQSGICFFLSQQQQLLWQSLK